MRIGINTLFLIPGEVGGSQTYLCETLRAWRALAGNDTFVLFTHRENDASLREQFSADARTEYVKLPFRASNRYARIVREQTELPIKAARQNLDALWSPGYTAPFALRLPQCVSILDMQYRRFPQDLSPLARWTTHGLVQAGARRASRILTISEFSKSEIARYTSAHPDRIDVSPLAANPAFATRLPDNRRQDMIERLIPARKTPYLLCVANTYPHKNVESLVQAFGLLHSACPHRLVLVGKERRGEPAVKKALTALPDPSRVTRLARVSDEDLVALYQGCSVFVFPSLYEGFGLPVLEAMMAGAPVVAADIPTTREIGGSWPWICDALAPSSLANAIQAALNEPEPPRAERLQAARAHANSFTWEKTAALTRQALCRAVEATGDASAG